MEEGKTYLGTASSDGVVVVTIQRSHTRRRAESILGRIDSLASRGNPRRRIQRGHAGRCRIHFRELVDEPRQGHAGRFLKAGLAGGPAHLLHFGSPLEGGELSVGEGGEDEKPDEEQEDGAVHGALSVIVVGAGNGRDSRARRLISGGSAEARVRADSGRRDAAGFLQGERIATNLYELKARKNKLILAIPAFNPRQLPRMRGGKIWKPPGSRVRTTAKSGTASLADNDHHVDMDYYVVQLCQHRHCARKSGAVSGLG